MMKSSGEHQLTTILGKTMAVWIDMFNQWSLEEPMIHSIQMRTSRLLTRTTFGPLSQGTARASQQFLHGNWQMRYLASIQLLRCLLFADREKPRCKGTLGASSSCNPATLTNWANEMSTYIKTLDPTHMVSVGDEGFFNRAGNSEWEYGGGEGVRQEKVNYMSNAGTNLTSLGR